MTISELHTLIENNETKTLELKKTTGELKEGMRTACAFLNTNGGWLVFGITPTSLRILGENVTDNTRREIAHAIYGLEPRTDIEVEYIDIPERPNCQVIAMHFEAWHDGIEPYTYDGCPYWRVESTTERMPRSVYDQRLSIARNQQYAWEQQPADSITMADLDENRIRQAVRISVDNGRMPATAMAASSEEILTKLNLMRNGQLTNAAVVLFAKEDSAYPQLLLRMAQFRTNSKEEFADNKRKKGNFFDLLDAGMAFLCDKLSIQGKIVGLQREEQCEIPIKALREALVNALCHRDYALRSDSVSIAVYSDRVEICNPGKFPYGLTAENIKSQHESHPHNPIIAEVLFRTTYLENWGSGVQRMITECRKVGVAEPAYHTTADAVVIAFARPNADGRMDSAQNEPKNGTDNGPQMSLKNEPKDDYKMTIKKEAQSADNEQEISEYNDHKMSLKNEPKIIVDEPKNSDDGPKMSLKNDSREVKRASRRASILRLIQANPLISKAELAQLLGVSLITIRRDLQSLSSVVRHVGPTNGGQWQFIDKNH